MPYLIPALLVAAVTATVIAGLAISAPGNVVQTLVRRLFLVFINLNPWTIGTWRSEFSKRETFLAAWLVVFVVVFFTLLFHPNCLEAFG